MTVTRTRLATAAVLVLLAACTSDSQQVASDEPLFESTDETASPSAPDDPAAGDPTADPTPSTSDPTESPTPTDPDQTATPDDFAVPDEITPEYIERVLNERSRISAEITRDILRMEVDPDAQQLPASLDARIADTAAGFQLGVSRRTKLDLLRSAEQRADLVPPDEFGSVRFTVERILTTEPCVGALITRDFSETDAEADDVSPYAVVFLQRFDGANTTGWKVTDLTQNLDKPGSGGEATFRQMSAEEIIEDIGEVCA